MSKSHTAVLNIADAAVRARALDPTQSFIVQAPAGSGKTELLTQRYLQLLARVEHPEQVLAITFTRKAAAEMRARIVKALQEALVDEVPEQAHARVTWQLARAVLAADAQHGWRLGEYPARLRIQTIDALNSMLARRLPILAGTGAALTPSDDARVLYEAACRQLLERLGEHSREAASLELLITHLGNRVDRLVDLLIDLLSKRDQWLHQVVNAGASTQLRALLESALAAVVNHHLAGLCSKLTAVSRNELWELTTHAAENLLSHATLNSTRRALLEACSDPSEVLGEGSKCLRAWQAVAEIVLTRSGELLKKVDRRHGFAPGGTKERMQRLLVEFASDEQLCREIASLRTMPRLTYGEDQWRILEALLVVLPTAVAELQLVFQSRGQADYVECALRALRALGTSDEPTDLALAFDYRLRHILVDEFQDTSFAQLDLLERLTAGWQPDDGRTLLCVGDPMQSIYRFRQAEVGLFLELQQRGLRNVPLQPLKLSANFRSTRAIVDWVNRVFPNVLSAHDDVEQGAVRYSPSEAAKSSDGGGVSFHPFIDSDAAAEAMRVVAIARETLARDEHSTIAVLITARSHASLIARELNKAGIEFQAVEIEQLLARPVVQDLIALTRALVHLGDRTAWLAVLRAPWCGLTLADLHTLAAGDADATIHQLLERAVIDPELQLTANGRDRMVRVHAILQRALDERGRFALREWVERAWNALGGPATTNSLQDLEDAEAYLVRLDALEINGDLEDVARLEEQLEGLCARPRAGAKSRVEIMTIHKAKGLEFDTVILPGLERWMRRDDRRLLRWTRVAGLRDGLLLAPLMPQGAQTDPIYRWLELLEQERGQRERGRLLYVAATRAKRELHLLASVTTRQSVEGVQLSAPRSGTMLSLLWHELEPVFAAALHAQPIKQFALKMTSPLLLKRLPLNWTLPAIEPPASSDSTFIDDVIALQRPDFDWVTETGRHVGTLVHRELDRMSRMSDATTRLANARPRLEAELAELGVPPERCRAAVDRVLAAIESTLSDQRGRWLMGLDRRLQEPESELALTGVINDQLIQGVIDRTFIDESGVRWIVDFKTSGHEGGGLEQFLSSEVDRYRPQLGRYAKLMRLFKPTETVKAALYFPLLRSWREVEV